MTSNTLADEAVRGGAPVTLVDLQGRLTCTVEEAGRALSLGRGAAYAAARRGEIPTLRFGNRLAVSVPRLLEMVGIPISTGSEPGSAEPGPA